MFDDNLSCVTFMSFVYGSLLFNNDQILERFHLKLSREYSASDINVLVKLAVNRSVRKLRIQTFGNPLKLPSCLSTCVTLKSLILYEVNINFVPSCFRLPSLKSLHLFSVKFSGYESVASLLRICPILEYLVVKQTQVFSNNMRTSITCETLKTLILRDLSINVPPSFSMPSLKTMHLLSVAFSEGRSAAKLLQNCPLLEDLVVKQTEVFTSKVCPLTSCRTLKTLTLSELSIKVVLPWFRLPSLKNLHLLSVKFLGEESIASFLPIFPVLECLVVDQTIDNSMMFETPYPCATTFPYLEHLELSTCSSGWANLLVCILKGAPRLQYLKLKSQHGAHYNDPMILANATCLKMATFSTRCGNKHDSMLRELKSLNRGSKTCQLLFDYTLM